MAVDRLGRRADEDQPGIGAGLREVGALGQEAVAGMHRVGAGAPGGVEDAPDVEVAVGGRAAPMRTASSARATCGACASASL